MEVLKICKHFNFEGKVVAIEKISCGNINESFKVTTQIGNGYFLQKINKCVFKNPRKIIENTITVLKELNKSNVFEENLNFITTKNGNFYHIDINGDYWRSYKFINNSVSFNSSSDKQIIFETGRAFGKFQLAFDGFDTNKLHTTIENFHNTQKRFYDLFESSKIAGERLNHSRMEFEYLKSIFNKITIFDNMQRDGSIVTRVTHNDTKCNNVLFNKNTQKVLCVVDLDTVMPGLMAHDFGDGARSIASSVGEEERNISLIRFDLDKFECFSNGFLSECKQILTKTELEFLYLGVFVITAELSARFLTDYYIRDRYFKINYPTQNLVRAQNQIALLKDIERKEQSIKQIVSKSTN